MIDRRNVLAKLAILGTAPLGLLAAENVPSTRLITNFQSAGSGLNWQTVNDTVMGGISTSRIEMTGRGVARFSGTLSLENNGGFASMRSSGNIPDLSGHDALVVRVKGDGRTYQLRVRMGRGWRVPDYSAQISTIKGVWQEHRLPLSEFVPGWRGRKLRGIPPIDPAKVQSIGILLGDKIPGEFELLIDWIKAASAGPVRG
jgi:NADH dehydrogenase [ubiquinone] 1 alpha subcomplex assembly factor 1